MTSINIQKFWLAHGDRFTLSLATAAFFHLAVPGVCVAEADNKYLAQEHKFRIDKGTLGQALDAIARQSGIVVLYPYELSDDEDVNPVSGTYTIPDALKILLHGSKFSGSLTKSGALIISHTDRNNTKSLENNMSGKGMKKTLLAASIAAIPMAASGEILNQQDVKDKDGKIDEEIVVRGIKGSLEQASKLKQNAASIQDSLVAEDIGKFPDQNVAESLQRITGVSISRTNGVGSGVTVRGFGPKFNIVRINGRTFATTDTGREFDFQVLPSDIIYGVDVVKSPTAKTPEGSIGGYVNIKTAKPLNNPGFNASLFSGLRYDDLSESTDPRFSGVVSNTFADDTMGFLVGLSYEDLNSRIDRHELTRWGTQVFPLSDDTRFEDDSTVPEAEGFVVRRPGRAIYASDQEARERLGVNATFQWQPTPEWEITLDGLYADLSRQALSLGYQLRMQSNNYRDVVVNENGTLVSATVFDTDIDGLFRQLGQDSKSYLFGGNGVWEKDNFRLEIDTSYSSAESTPGKVELVPRFTGDNREINLTTPASGSGDVLAFTSTIDVNDPGSIRSHWNDFRHKEIDDEIFEMKVEGKYTIDEGPLRSIEVGLSYHDRTKSNDSFRQIETGCSPCGGTVDLPDDIFIQNGVVNLLDQVGGTFARDIASTSSVDAAVQAVQEVRDKNSVAGNPWNAQALRPGDSFSNEETITSFYTQFNWEGSSEGFDWFGNVGFRYADTDTRSLGFGEELLAVRLDPARTDEVRLSTEFSEPMILEADNGYSHFLPSANLTLDFNNGFQVRAGMAKTITKPDIESIGVDQDHSTSSGGTVTTSGGNPDLLPYEATQFDLSFEYYGDSDVFSFAFFHKDIDSFISTITFTRPFTSADVDPEVVELLDGPLTEVVNLNQNREGGTISGVEVAALHYFQNLPGLFSNLGVQANYSFVDSRDEDAEPLNLPNISDPGSVLEGLARHSYNLVGFYDDGEFQARLAYNWRDTFLSARQGDLTRGLPEHDDAYGQFDFSASYDINDTVSISAEVINLLDEGRVEFADIRERVTSLEFSGRRIFLGVRARF